MKSIVFYTFRFNDGSSLTVPPNRLTCITLDFIKGFQGLTNVFKTEYVEQSGPGLIAAYYPNDNGVMHYVPPESQWDCQEQLYHRCAPEKIENWEELFDA